MSESCARSGYELAAKILETHPDDAIETMLKYSNGAECDWLEFKAGMKLLPESEKKHETLDDLYWDYLLSIIAMANTRGGAFIIGVKDRTHEVVPLESCDTGHVIEKRGKEAYLREVVVNNLDRPERKWTTKDRVVWSIPRSVVPFLDKRIIPYNGTDVIVILVPPREIGEEFFVTSKSGLGEFKHLPVRDMGEIGHVKRLTKDEEFADHRANRGKQLLSAQLGAWWAELDKEAAVSKERVKIEEAISDYYQRQTQKARQLMAVFTPLDAEENVFGSEDADLFYSPEAIETIENDDWLDDDGEEPNGLEDSSGEGEFDDDLDGEYEEGSDRESDDDSEESEAISREARKGNLLELLKTEPRVIVSGEPGGGKTTCLTYYTLQYAKADGADRMLAVFIPMGQWKKGGSLGKMMSGVTGLDAAQLHNLIVENRLLLVIDAVNECPDVYRAAAINDIGVFLSRNPTVRAVISTRHPDELSALHLPVFHVQPMDADHRRRYLAHYLGDEGEAECLLRQIDTMPGGETIAENPMLLRLVVEVYRESNTRRLPNGRAGLYRRSLHAWYKREKAKAENAGIRLHWNEHKTIEMLAELAFRSRLAGYRDVPIEEVSTIWGKNSDQQITELCQGPIIYRDDEFLRFRHETFQEYLCAEYLVAHPSELPQWTQADYARWGMPFAYVVELFEQQQKRLPESFLLAAWNLNPWLGVALTTKSKINGTLLARWKDTIYLRIIRGQLTTWMLRHVLHDTPSLWYRQDDVALRYVVQVSSRCQDKWSEFERSQLSCIEGIWARQALILAKNWIVLDNPREIFQYHAPEEWDSWIENATIERAILLIDAGIAKSPDFDCVKAKWLSAIDVRAAIRLLKSGLIVLADISDKIRGWIELATPQEAKAMIMAGLVAADSFEDKRSLWITDKSITSTRQLIQLGFAQIEDFKDDIEKWKSIATPKLACELIKSGFAWPSDFHGRSSGWFKHPQYAFVRDYVVQIGKAQIEGVDWDARVKGWIGAASVESAVLLIADGLATRDDFKERIKGWIAFSTTRKLKVLVNRGLIDERQYLAHYQMRHDIIQACYNVRKNLKDRSCYASKIPLWIKEGSYYAIKEMIGASFITNEMLKARVEKLIHLSLPKDAIRLIREHIASGSDFLGRALSWKELLTPDTAWRLLKYGAIDEAVLVEMRAVWRNNISPQTIDAAVLLGCLPETEAVEIRRQWKCCRGLSKKKRITRIPAADWAANTAMLSVGSHVRGKIRYLGSDNIIIEIAPNVTGVVEKSEFSWTRRSAKADESFRVGDEIEVAILSIDPEAQEITLSIRQCLENPWDKVSIQYRVGSRVRGKICHLTNFGAFVELADGIDGMIHVSDINWSGKINHPSECLQKGQEVEAVVLNIDPQKQRIALGLKQMTLNPSEIAKKFPVGSHVKGKVRNLMAYGAFIEVAPGIEGLAHISDMSWTRKINHPSECLQKGQEVEVVVLGVDSEKQQIALGLKQAQQDPRPNLVEKYQVGMIVRRRVSKIASFGAFIELEDGVDGLVHVSEISEGYVGKVKDVLQVGQEVEARVVKVDNEAFRIGLSIRAVSMSDDEFKALVEELNAARNVESSEEIETTYTW